MPSQRLKIELTERIRKYLSNVAPEECTKRGIDPTGIEVDLDDLGCLLQSQIAARREGDEAPPCLNDLVAESRVVRRCRSQEQTAVSELSELEAIRERAKERQYQRSIKNLTFIRSKNNNGDAYGDYRTSLSMGVNSIIGLFLTFFAGYWGAFYIGIYNLTVRVFIGLAMSLTCLLIEVVFFITYDEKRRVRARRLNNKEGHSGSRATSSPQKPREASVSATGIPCVQKERDGDGGLERAEVSTGEARAEVSTAEARAEVSTEDGDIDDRGAMDKTEADGGVSVHGEGPVKTATEGLSEKQREQTSENSTGTLRKRIVVKSHN